MSGVRALRWFGGSRRRAVIGGGVLGGLALAAGLIATAIASPASPSTAVRSSSALVAGSAALPSTAGFPSGTGQPGIFTDRCGFSHEAADDPILAPNAPGTAMHHDFYGNTTTSATSSAASLVDGPTTCTTSADSSAYWTPVLYQNGTALTPGPALIYWRRPARDTASVQTIPTGLQMIAGNESATEPQSTTVTAWTCANQTGMAKATSVPHDCAAGSDLRLVVTFPSCWDGHTLSGAGQGNVVYRLKTGCPSSHPVQIPQIVFHVNYPTSSAAGLTVSMTPTMQGSTNTEHVDFINGWNERILTADVAACVATSTRCGPVTGTTATPQGPKAATRRSRSPRRTADHDPGVPQTTTS
ncbi:protein of unknown function [Frankineae bacterium MT45]|nr:protein of unknown function [Frankineae bacterium MT45]